MRDDLKMCIARDLFIFEDINVSLSPNYGFGNYFCPVVGLEALSRLRGEGADLYKSPNKLGHCSTDLGKQRGERGYHEN